jgi:starch-binding outer membrane protein, SusD/RagB family
MYMKKNTLLYKFLLPVLVLFSQACKKDYGDLNHATVEAFTANASAAELNNLVSGTESGMRSEVTLYLDDMGVPGREYYRLSGAEPRYVTDILGGGQATLGGSNFYITNTWGGFYQVVKNCNILIRSASNSKLIGADERSGYLGFARTIKAYDLLLSLNLVDTNGIRIQVEDPNHLGPIVKKADALNAIKGLLDSAQTDFSHATIDYTLAGFSDFPDAPGMTRVNRALAARVAAYRQDWAGVLSNLNASFFDVNGDFSTGVYHVFGTGSGDQLNGSFIPQNQAGEVRVAHPSFATDIAAGDDRIGKATLRTAAVSSSGLSSDRDVWVSTSSTAPIAIIRNEELILLYAEAEIQLNDFPDAITALNKIRTAHHLAAYAGPSTKDALLTEMLNQRRYSLFAEGHRWIDLRRYNLLNTLPIDRTDDNIWSAYPLPVTETP